MSVAAISNRFNTPNLIGPLYDTGNQLSPLLDAIGGMNGGGRSVDATEFATQSAALDAVAAFDVLEGAAAPTAKTYLTTDVKNVLTIIHEAVGVTYTKKAVTGQVGSPTVSPAADIQGPLTPGSNFAWQMHQTMGQIRLDMNNALWNSTYAYPTDNATSRNTRGLLAAITSSAEAGAAAALSKTLIETLVESMDSSDSGWGNMRLWVSSLADLKRITDAYVTLERSNTHGGASIRTIETEAGVLEVQRDKHLGAGNAVIANMDELNIAWLENPEKGYLFAEPLAKTGASDNVQIYGEFGLDYGLEDRHGKLTGLAT